MRRIVCVKSFCCNSAADRNKSLQKTQQGDHDMTVIGILGLGFFIYVIYCLIQQEQIRKEERRKWEPYHPKRPEKKDEYKEALDEMLMQASSPYYSPGDLPDSVDEYIRQKKHNRK